MRFKKQCFEWLVTMQLNAKDLYILTLRVSKFQNIGTSRALRKSRLNLTHIWMPMGRVFGSYSHRCGSNELNLEMLTADLISNHIKIWSDASRQKLIWCSHLTKIKISFKMPQKKKILLKVSNSKHNNMQIAFGMTAGDTRCKIIMLI